MLVFLDESGDPGMKLSGGSSDLFIVTLVIFNDHDEAQAADDRVRLLRQELGVNEAFEFKFNKMNRALAPEGIRVPQVPRIWGPRNHKP